jgi:DNA-binding FrmR family transcriptional regulator
MINTENKGKVMGRLRSADGHLASIIKMVQADLPAEDVLKHLTAVQAALRQINILVFNREVESFARKIRNNVGQQERLREARRLLDLYNFPHR